MHARRPGAPRDAAQARARTGSVRGEEGEVRRPAAQSLETVSVRHSPRLAVRALKSVCVPRRAYMSAATGVAAAATAVAVYCSCGVGNKRSHSPETSDGPPGTSAPGNLPPANDHSTAPAPGGVAWTATQSEKYYASQGKAAQNRVARTSAAAGLVRVPRSSEPEPEPEPKPKPDPEVRPAYAPEAQSQSHEVQPERDWWAALETGDTIRLEHVATGFRLALLVATTWSAKAGKGDGLLLARPAQPYHRLLATSSQRTPLRWKTTLGCPDALWLIQEPTCSVTSNAEPLSSLCTVRNLKRRTTYLAMAADGQLTIGGSTSVWRWLPATGAVTPASASVCAEPTIDVPRQLHPSASESFEQFVDQGYCVLPGLVSVGKSESALRLINHHLGSTQSRQVAAGEHGLGSEFLPQDAGGASSVEPAGVVKLGTLALHPDLNSGLLGPSECATLARVLRLAPQQINPPAGCQLALRFPLPPIPWSSDSSRNDSSGELRGQQQAIADVDTLEGLRGRLLWHTDINKYNDRKSFDFVVGVFLLPVRRAQDGALWVLPTSHLAPTPTPAAALEYAASGITDPTPILTYNPVSLPWCSGTPCNTTRPVFVTCVRACA